jgi:two-component sensor histidine kinase
MQAISSLLYLQSKKVTDKKTKELFNECITRVRSMALIHQKLYRSSDFISIYYFKDYIDDLIRELCVSYRIDFGKVKFDVRVDNISFYIDYAIPLGLIINELVSNSLKHAFPSTWKDTRNIAIILSESDDATIKFTYKDNGIGMPENIDPCNTNSLGLTLIKSLAENQLGGTMRFMRNRGVVFQINFSKN